MHIHTDSTGAKATCTRNGLSPKTKHIQLRYLWLQTYFTSKAIELHKVQTNDNFSDALTKHLPAPTLSKHMNRLGLLHVTSVMNFSLNCVTSSHTVTSYVTSFVTRWVTSVMRLTLWLTDFCLLSVVPCLLPCLLSLLLFLPFFLSSLSAAFPQLCNCTQQALTPLLQWHS